MKSGSKRSKKPSNKRKPRAAGLKPKTGITSLESVFISLFVTLTLLLFVGGAVVYYQLNSDISDKRVEDERTLIKSYSKQIEQTFQQYINFLGQTSREPDLLNAIKTQDDETLARREKLLNYMFPAALRIRILPPDFDEPDNSINPPISYSCLDMLHKTRSGKEAAVEVHLLGKPTQHIDVIHNIKDTNGKSLGSLLLTLPVNALKQMVGRMHAPGGLLELRQINDSGKTITIARRGNPESKRDEKPITNAISNTRWEIAYWPNAHNASFGGSNNILYWLIIGIIWLVFSAVLYVLYRRLFKALLNDQVMVIKLFKDIQHGEISTSYPIAVKNCMGAMEQLRMIGGELTGLRSKKSGSRKGPDSQLNVQEKSSELNDIGFGLSTGTDALEVREISKADIQESGSGSVPASIFRAYDIRGVVPKTLNADIVQKIGRALGSEAEERGQAKIVVARDGRLSGPELGQALMRGLQQSGREVIDIGRVPTPVLYFASHYLGNGSGVMLTGSHNPPDYNGLKMMLRGETLHGDDISALKTRIDNGDLINGEGSVQTIDVVPSYLERITSDVRLERPLKVVIDCGNGVAGEIAPALYRALGCEVIEMFCEVDGNFPNHHPDPSKPENMIQMTRTVTEQGADLGMAFDGDGDRLGIVDASGKIIWPDRLLMLMAIDVLSRQPDAQIIYDVKCTRHLEKVITDNGGKPLMWKTGHSFIKAKMLETGAQLAGEMSGHIFFKERWMGFDDALYAGARLLEILSSDSRLSNEVFAELPESVSTPELNLHLREGEHFALMEKLKSQAHFPGARIIDIDGLRMEFEDGWGLIRASNTTPSLVLRFEADNASALGRIQDMIRTQLLSIEPDLDLPF